MYVCMDGWIVRQRDWMDVLLDRRIGWLDATLDYWNEKRMYGCVWVCVQKDEWMNGWLNEWKVKLTDDWQNNTDE